MPRSGSSATERAKVAALNLKLQDGPAVVGEIEFQSSQPNRELTKFAVVGSENSELAIVKLLQAWLPQPPSVILSITGSAQAMNLPNALEKLFCDGLAAAAQASQAWVFTGGMDSGVMALTGRAFESRSSIPIIGFAPYRMVTHRELLFDDARRSAAAATPKYVKRAPNSGASAALDPLHTHHILIDAGERSSWGAEISRRVGVERMLREEANEAAVPSVLIVVQGGLGTFNLLR